MDTLRSLKNVDIVTSAATKEIIGNGKEVTGLKYEDRTTGEEKTLELSGLFIQIGLLPNTKWLEGSGVELNQMGEIVIDAKGKTNVPGVYGAGDCATVAFKQIVIATGTGATAGLSAWEHNAIG